MAISSVWIRFGICGCLLALGSSETTFAFQLFSKGAFTCKSSPKDTLDEILVKKDEFDITEDVDKLQQLLKYCKMPLSQLEATPEDLETWKREGFEAEYQRAHEAIEMAQFVRPDGAAAKKLRKYGKLLGREPKSIDEMIERSVNSAMKVRERDKELCQNKRDFHDKIGSVRNQSGNRSCFAYAAGDLLSFKLGKRVSVLDVALKYYDKKLREHFATGKSVNSSSIEKGGGVSLYAIQTSISKGVCLEDEIRTDQNEVQNLTSILDFLERVRNRKSKALSDKFCRSQFSALSGIYPGLKLDEFVDILRNAKPADLASDLANVSCVNPIHPKFEVRYEVMKSKFDKTNVFRVIDNLLDRDEASLINFSASGLADRKVEISKSDHSAIIVGRKYDPLKQECLYLLRNSWGKKSPYVDSHYDDVDGNIWVPKSVLFKSIYDVEYLQ